MHLSRSIHLRCPRVYAISLSLKSLDRFVYARLDCECLHVLVSGERKHASFARIVLECVGRLRLHVNASVVLAHL